MMSRRERRYAGVRYAKAHGLDYKTVYGVVMDLEAFNADELNFKLDKKFFGSEYEEWERSNL